MANKEPYIKSTRILGGRRYRLYNHHVHREDAELVAKRLRQSGDLARVSAQKILGIGGRKRVVYAVYSVKGR